MSKLLNAVFDYIAFDNDPTGTCAKATQDLVAKFPDLRRVRGHYYCQYWGEREHWWCVAPDGTIVDPTASQFPSLGGGKYIEWQEGEEEPIGRCINCGGYVFTSKNNDMDHNFCSTVCADQCSRELTKGKL